MISDRANFAVSDPTSLAWYNCMFNGNESSSKEIIMVILQCLQHRALQPHDPLPELSPLIANSLNPPQEVSARCEAQCDKIKDLFKLEQVKKEEKKTGENMFKQK